MTLHFDFPFFLATPRSRPIIASCSGWPLKVGVHIDILEAAPDFDPTAVGRALSYYTTGRRYLQSMVAGRSRIDLSGASFGIVTPEQAAAAKQWLAKRQTTPNGSTITTTALVAAKAHARGA
jgi:sRNA-binding protein